MEASPKAADRPRMLMLSPDLPRANGSGGEIRTYHLLRAFATAFDVTLVLMRGLSDERAETELRRLCGRIIAPDRVAEANDGPTTRIRAAIGLAMTLVAPSRNHWNAFWARYLHYLEQSENGLPQRALLGLFQIGMEFAGRLWVPPPPPASSHYLLRGLAQVADEVESVLDQERFDVVVAEHSFSYPVATAILKGVKDACRPYLVCDAHNVESHLFAQYAAQEKPGARRWFLRQQQRLLTRWERTAFAESRLTLACSEEDRSRMHALSPNANVTVVPNGVDSEYFRTADDRKRDAEPRLLFTGTMGYSPNADAVRYFHESIFPKIRERRPDCRWLIAGRDAATAFNGWCDEGIEILSDPDDIRPCFERSGIFVVPLRSGGGTRLKILEAMAMGLPVVSTRCGAEGVPYREGEHLLLADDPAAFADTVLRLLDDETLREKLASQACAWVREHYDWKVVGRQAVESLLSDYAPNGG